MNKILLHPTDVLFFRDGRPMIGSLAGHGAAWPMPNVINAAFRAALHRAFPNASGDHLHRSKNGDQFADSRTRRFGSLVTTGPFPVNGSGTWFFPRPCDVLVSELEPTLLPVISDWSASSLPKPLRYAVGSIQPPAKETRVNGWLSGKAYAAYIEGGTVELDQEEALDDTEIFDAEHQIGIEIDDESGTAGQGTAAGKFYSAHYLRLREGWRLGTLANSEGKGQNLFDDLLKPPQQIIVGGQQRVCTAERLPRKAAMPLPLGRRDGFTQHEEKFLLKWLLLTPAIWPEIRGKGNNIKYHPGGWLPNWVNAETGEVQLLDGPGVSKAKRLGHREAGKRIRANLVSAIVPKPVAITGWRLASEDRSEPGGAKSVHLAVPAGAIYYFETESAEQARKLADALNWQGTTNGQHLVNRRSALCGEKGFGLGVCGTWTPHPGSGTSTDVPVRV